LVLDFSRDGAAIIQRSINDIHIEELRQEFASLDFKAGARPFVLSQLVSQLLMPNGCFGGATKKLGLELARPVRVLAFDKTPASNWNLGWHQDRVVAVKERRDVSGFGNWTLKNGVPHVEAPVEVLRNMFSLRLHLDDCNAENGALKILAGSAGMGKLADAQVRGLASTATKVVCEAALGEILAMRALAVHASEPAKKPSHRRVLHIDYCVCELPDGLEWALLPAS
jgi:phytanoyl-CoA dioxygenase PhyH